VKKLILNAMIVGMTCSAGDAFTLKRAGKPEKKEIKTEPRKKISEPRKVSLRGFFVGFGGDLSLQRFNCKENREFTGVDQKIKSAVLGPTLSLGFNKKISPNFTMGIEGGMSFGFNAKQQHIGNVFSKDSARFRELVRDVNTLFVNIGRQIEAAGMAAAGDGQPNTIAASTYVNFANTMQYLGGGGNTLTLPFITSAASADEIYNDTPTVQAPNPNASLSNFTTAEYNALDAFSGPNLESINLLREFITGYYPNLATVLREFNSNGGAALNNATALILGNFFQNSDTGTITNGTVSSASVSDVLSARKDLQDHTYKVDITNNNQTIFRVYPHLAATVGCSLPGSKATVFLKGGTAYISGHASCALWEKAKDFGVLSPLVGAEIQWPLKRNWRIGLELTHMFKATKKFEEIKVLGIQVEPSINVRKTKLGISFSHHFC
jgi:hypothetical protein